MQDRLKAILQRIKDWWMKFNKTQRALFISITAVVIIAIVILAIVFTRTTTVVLKECTSASEATEVRTLLSDSNISCIIDENYVVRVNEENYVEAKLVLGSNNIPSDGYSLNDAVSGGFTDTAANQKKKYTAYLESKFSKDLESMDGIKKARVTISFPDSDNTIFSENEDASITAMLTLTKEMTEEQATAIGLTLATNVGSNNTNNVVIMDNNANLLYYGGTSNSYSVSSASQKVQTQLENAIIAKAKQLLLATDLYSEVTVSPKLDVNFDEVEIIDHTYKAPEGSDEGLKKHSYEVNSTGAIADASGVAGTESNDQDTTYEIQNADGTTSEYTLKEYDWYQNETVTTTKPASGKINYDNSSVSIVAMKYNVLNEEDAEAQGLLEDMTWEEYKAANSDPVETEVDEKYTSIVATGTGIDKDDVSILAYSRYIFYDKEAATTSPFLVIEIILAVLIAGLLVFIIIRSTRPVAVEETEPELSVEDMLATTKEKQQPLEEIDLQDKSETRIAIEKFVDENPEAVALLLRNWLNEGWS